MRPWKIGLAALGLAGGIVVVAVLGYQFSVNARLRAEIAGARLPPHELAAARAEHSRLAAAAPARAAAAHAEEEELARRRIEIEALRLKLATLQRTKLSRDAGRLAELEQLKTRAAAIPVPPGMIPVEALQNLGRATPADAWQTDLWASTAGNFQAAIGSLAFAPEAHDTLQAIFDRLPEEERAAFGTPESMGARVLSMDTSIVPASPPVGFPRYQLVAETPAGPDEVRIATRIQMRDGKFLDGPAYRMHRSPEGWKRLVRGEDVALVEAAVAALPSAQRLQLAKK